MKKRKKKQHRRTYKYQMREHPQNMRLGNMLDDLCDVHNHFLKLENRYYRRFGKYAGRFRLQPHLTDMLKRTHQHWAWIPRDTLDAVIINLHRGFERFFDIPGTGRPNTKDAENCGLRNFNLAISLKKGVSVSLSLPSTSSLRYCGISVSNIIVSSIKSDNGHQQQNRVRIVDTKTKI